MQDRSSIGAAEKRPYQLEPGRSRRHLIEPEIQKDLRRLSACRADSWPRPALQSPDDKQRSLQHDLTPLCSRPPHGEPRSAQELRMVEVAPSLLQTPWHMGKPTPRIEATRPSGPLHAFAHHRCYL